MPSPRPDRGRVIKWLFGLVTDRLERAGPEIAVWRLDPTLVDAIGVITHDFAKPSDDRILVQCSNRWAGGVRAGMQIQATGGHTS